MKPSIGRIVLYITPDGEIRPAIIVRVWSDTCVNVKVFEDPANECEIEGHHCSSVTYSEAEYAMPRSWHWPPRV
jgi:hypothetical protein